MGITPAEIQPYCCLHEALHDKRQLQHHCCNENVSSTFASGKSDAWLPSAPQCSLIISCSGWGLNPDKFSPPLDLFLSPSSIGSLNIFFFSFWLIYFFPASKMHISTLADLWVRCGLMWRCQWTEQRVCVPQGQGCLWSRLVAQSWKGLFLTAGLVLGCLQCT